MLEKPDIPDDRITATVQSEFGLAVTDILFLPIGADVNTAVYRLTDRNGAAYFLKLRHGHFDPLSVQLPRFLFEQGVQNIIPPLRARNLQPWAELAANILILYPFVEACNGYQTPLSDQNWIEFGAALRFIHTMQLPDDFTARMQRETFSPCFRRAVAAYLSAIERENIRDPAAAELVRLLRAQRSLIWDLLQRAGQLGEALQAQNLPYVACHSDLHAGNLLIDDRQRLYLVDWDAPILAPKERDLMYAGGAQGFQGHTLDEEEAIFYQGYGQAVVSRDALAYYRFERIIQDMAAFCEQILDANDGGEDRLQALQYVKSNFDPGGTVEAAYRTLDTALPGSA
ncbi:MAG: phosphotransferase [Anaerolineales bacterium]|jgi:spectinomycin phosphotransferase|nr:phosphotransferase [Anaerolineales bacterium]